MTPSLGMSILLGASVWFAGWSGGPALAQSTDPSQLLGSGSNLLKQQQDVESRLAESQAKRQELEQERRRLLEEAGRNRDERATYNKTCESSVFTFANPGQCAFDGARLSRDGSEVGRQIDEVNRRMETLNSEAGRLKTQKEQLKQQADSLDSKLNQVEFSGVTKECVGQQKTGGLQGTVSAYERCWDGTSADQPRFKSESPTSSLPSIGPIEQMGIEDEKRRRRKARQKELSGE
ncbi:MAG: hypothetical protein FJ245_02835 [Nitrospira sp.]|nr:hypothetical protein [Nitrospira sp.]